MVQHGIGVVLSVDNKILGGQRDISLKRTADSIDITNKINGEWGENLAGLKTWSINCNGFYVIDSESFSLLENAYMNNLDVDVEISFSNKTYSGKAIITNFPLNATYNLQYKYSITLLGNGELKAI